MGYYVCEPLEHYGNTDLNDCECWLCANWRLRRRQARIKAAQFEHGHCRCSVCTNKGASKMIWNCVNYMSAQYDFLAASNRRDVYIELAYHSRFYSPYIARRLMSWAERKLRPTTDHRGRDNRGWWAVHAERKVIGEWLAEFEKETGINLPPPGDPDWKRKGPAEPGWLNGLLQIESEIKADDLASRKSAA